MEKLTSKPTGKFLLRAKRTPLAEIFLVRPAISLVPAESTTGRERGNLTAQRTSCRPCAVTGLSDRSGDSGFKEFIDYGQMRMA
jgi:hypothetical protein